MKRAAAAVLLLACACGSYVCPSGTRRATVCTQCGPAGGCVSMESQCAPVCSGVAGECPPGKGCFEGVCQAGGCI